MKCSLGISNFLEETSSLGISELKWTGMGEFNSDDHYIYYCGQESLRRNGVAIVVAQIMNSLLPNSDLN